MNEMDIENAVEVLAHDSIMSPAAQFLNTYKDRINNCSDGWPYWTAGRKCAESLMKLVDGAITAKRGFTHNYTAPTQKEVKAAMTRINTFIKTNKFLVAENTIPLPY